MIEVNEALRLVLENAADKPATTCNVADALGQVLAEDVVSDIDSPPHDKALMDGYAVRAEDVSAGAVTLTILEEITAGAVPTKRVTARTASRIMTGAPLPEGADAVVMVEKTQQADDGATVHIDDASIQAGQNIMKRAASLRRGDVVLRAGKVIRPMEVGLLSEVGKASVSAVARPTVAVLSTGNELVPVDETPAAGQIRNSNGPMLCALAEKAGGLAVNLGIGRDDEAELARLIAEGLTHDVLVLSGGVSAGVLDLVPKVLSKAGVQQVFHKVNLKPGKPLWFGVREGNTRSIVFGLPGNPVSSLVCFELFARPAIARLCGIHQADEPITARLAAPHRQRGDRPTYWPSRLTRDKDGLIVETLGWLGSADLRTLTEADVLAAFPPGDREFAAGDEVTVIRL